MILKLKGYTRLHLVIKKSTTTQDFAILSVLIGFKNIYIDVCTLRGDWWEVLLDLDNGLVPKWRQAII